MGSEITINGILEAVTPSSTPVFSTTSPANQDHRGEDTGPASQKGTKREKLKILKERTVNALQCNSKDTGIPGEPDSSLLGSNSISPRLRPSSLVSRTIVFLAHPRTALKASLAHITAGRLSALNTPYIPQAAEAGFVEAHDERDEARKNQRQGDFEDAEDRGAYMAEEEYASKLDSG